MKRKYIINDFNIVDYQQEEYIILRNIVDFIWGIFHFYLNLFKKQIFILQI